MAINPGARGRPRWLVFVWCAVLLAAAGPGAHAQRGSRPGERPDSRTPRLAITSFTDSTGTLSRTVVDTLRALLGRRVPPRRLFVSSQRDIEGLLAQPEPIVGPSPAELRAFAQLLRATALLDLTARPDDGGIRVRAALHFPHQRTTDSLPPFVARSPRDAARRLMASLLGDARLARKAPPATDARADVPPAAFPLPDDRSYPASLEFQVDETVRLAGPAAPE